GPDRVAVVSVEPSTDREYYLIQETRGPAANQLHRMTTHGPYAEEQLAEPFAEVVQQLKGEGFAPAGLPALLTDLDNPNPTVTAHAAARLGWRREQDAVDKLLTLVPNAVDDICALIDALGAIGDPRAIPVAREQAERKLLSRRRSGVEALRNLGDAEGLAEARQRALERLPESVRTSLASGNEYEPTEKMVKGLAEAVLALDKQQQALSFDTLYELGTPAPVRAVREILKQVQFGQAHIWRCVKSVFKRSQLRHDYTTFGQVSHDIESQ